MDRCPSRVYGLSPEEAALQRRFRDWLSCHPPTRAMRKGWYCEDAAERWASLLSWQSLLASGRWLGLSWPRRYGGRGSGIVAEFLLGESLARFGAPLPANWIGLAAAGPALLAFGTERQKRRHLPALLRGSEIWCLAFTEEASGSDMSRVRTRAVRRGAGYVLDGVKCWSTHSPLATHALVLARTGSRAQGAAHTLFIVDLRSKGVAVEPLRRLTGESGFGRIRFQGVRVPAQAVLGVPRGGLIGYMRILLHEALSAWDFPPRLDWGDWGRRARARLRREPGGSEALLQRTLEVEAARLLRIRALRAVERGESYAGWASLAKLASTESAVAAARDAMTWERAQRPPGRPVGWRSWTLTYLYSLSGTIGRGSSEIQRGILAARLLGQRGA